MLMGAFLQTNRKNTATLGFGVGTGNTILNNVTGSIMFGSSSTLPTLTITPNLSGSTTTIGSVGIGTTQPSSTLHIVGTLQITASSTFGGHVNSTGTTPTLSSCGGTPSIVGTDTAGRVSTGTGVVTSCTVTFAQNYKSPPVCTVLDATVAVGLVGATNSSTLTLSAAVTFDSDVIHYICIGID